MGVGPAVFQSAGQRSEHWVPGAYSRSATVGSGGGDISAGNGVILGKSVGGQPHELYIFSTLGEARDVLVEGELLNAVSHAFNPGGGYAPQSIRAMRVNPGTQAKRSMKSGSVRILDLKSFEYGVHMNQLKMQLVNGTNPGTKKVLFACKDQSEKIDNIGKKSISMQYTGEGTSATLDVNNVGLSVEVDGASASPALDFEGLNGLRVGEWKEFTVEIINPTSDQPMVKAIIGVEGIDPSLLEAEYWEVQGSPGWMPLDLSQPYGPPSGFPLNTMTAKFRICPKEGAENITVQYHAEIRKFEGGTLTNEVLSSTTIGEVEIVGADKPYSGHNIPAYDTNSGSLFLAFENFPTIEDIVGKLNDTGYFAAVQLETESNIPANELDAVNALDVKSSAKILKSDFYALIHALENAYYIGKGNVEKVIGATNTMPDNDPDFAYFEGALAGSYTVNDWNDALDKLEAEDIQIVSTPSTDHAVHVLVSNHCTAMCNIQNRKERTFFVGGRIGETIAEALENAASLNTKLGSYCFPWINVNSPLTGASEDLPASYLACKLLGMEVALAVNEPLTWKTVDVNKFGIRLKTSEMETLIKGGVLCVGPTDDKRLAVIRAMTTVNSRYLQDVERSMVREDLFMNRDIRQQYSTGVGRPGIGKAGEAVQTLLDTAKDWKGQGLIVPDDDGNNVWGIVPKKEGDKTYIEFHRNLTAPQNFFFITGYNHVYESKTTVEL